MMEHGIRILEDIFIPKFADVFLINETEGGWPCNIFLYECTNPDDNHEWYGYILNQLPQHKYDSGNVDLNCMFIPYMCFF